MAPADYQGKGGKSRNSTINASAYLLSSGTEYSTCDARSPVENLEECEEGQDGRNERDDLCRTVSIEFRSPICIAARNMEDDRTYQGHC